MPKLRSGEFDQYQYEQNYIKKNIKLVHMSLNRTKEEDMQILDWLSQKDSISAYLKSLIRKDMEGKT